MAADLAHLPALRIRVRFSLDSWHAGERLDHLLFSATSGPEQLQHRACIELRLLDDLVGTGE
jgi:hypothetical protein